MKKRIVSLITAAALVLSMLTVFGTVASAESYPYPVAQVNGVNYYAFDSAWAKAVESGGTFKLLRS